MLNEGQTLPVVEPQVQQSNIVESLKNSLQPETIARKLGIDKNTLIDIVIYGAIGFIVGFLLKKYSEYFIAFVLFIITVVILQQFGYISIDFNIAKIHEALGLPLVPMVNTGFNALLIEWMKSNIPAMASLIIGLCIGLKCA